MHIKRPILFAIEGNLAVGKSTIISKIQEFYGEDCVSFPEPVALWSNFHSSLSARNQIICWGQSLNPYNLLHQNILHPSKFSFPMCMETLSTAAQAQLLSKSNSDKDLAVIERQERFEVQCLLWMFSHRFHQVK